MKDTEIHEGLENKLLREAICDGFINNWADKFIEKPIPNYPKGLTIDCILWGIEQKEEELRKIKFQIAKDLNRLAYTKLMFDHGWAEHDISDLVSRTGEYCRSFIGTEEEYNNLLIKIKE